MKVRIERKTDRNDKSKEFFKVVLDTGHDLLSVTRQSLGGAMLTAANTAKSLGLKSYRLPNDAIVQV